MKWLKTEKVYASRNILWGYEERGGSHRRRVRPASRQ